METFDLRLRLAQIAQREGRAAEAAALYAQIVYGNPLLVEAWWGLSQTIHDPEHALFCVKHVLALAPYHPAAHARLKALSLEVMTEHLAPGSGPGSEAQRTLNARLDAPMFK